MEFINLDTNKKGHYSPAVISNNLVFISGQLPINYDTGKMEKDDIHLQTNRVLNNIKLILSKVELTLDNVVQTRIYISDIKYWDIVNEIYATHFVKHKPSRAIVPTRELHHGALIEIEAIAELEK